MPEWYWKSVGGLTSLKLERVPIECFDEPSNISQPTSIKATHVRWAFNRIKLDVTDLTTLKVNKGIDKDTLCYQKQHLGLNRFVDMLTIKVQFLTGLVPKIQARQSLPLVQCHTVSSEEKELVQSSCTFGIGTSKKHRLTASKVLFLRSHLLAMLNFPDKESLLFSAEQSHW